MLESSALYQSHDEIRSFVIIFIVETVVGQMKLFSTLQINTFIEPDEVSMPDIITKLLTTNHSQQYTVTWINLPASSS